YAASGPIFAVWSLTIALAVLQVDGVLRVYADTRFLFGMYLLKLVIIASLVGPFLSHLRLQGAVLVTLLALLVAKAVALVRIRGLMAIGQVRLLPWPDLARAASAALLAAAASLAVERAVPLSPLPLLVTSGIVYAAVGAGLWCLMNREQARVLWMRGRRRLAWPAGALGAGGAGSL